jgi:uncharacterized protein (TIGR02172 family)
METININDYDLRGEGSTAQTYYSHDSKRLAKLYFNKISAESATHEFTIAQTVHRLGIPTPRPIRLITDGSRIGTEFELFAPVGKRSFARIFSEEPQQIEPLSREFARMTRQLHATPADTNQLPSMKAMVQYWVERAIATCKNTNEDPGIPDDIIAAINQTLAETPDTPTCLHGDLHPGNVITDGVRRVWIDVGDFAYGVPEWDLASMYYNCNMLPEERVRHLFHIDTDAMRRHWHYFISEYYGTDDPEECSRRSTSLQRLAAVKMFYMSAKNNNGTPDKHLFQLFR